MTDASEPAAHARTRQDHAAEIAEDYVEAIADTIEAHGTCRVTDLADRFGVTHVTVIRTLQRLERDGLVRTEPYKPVGLTASGHTLAAACRRRHEIVERFLLSIGVPPDIAAVDAEGIEHHVSDATLERFRRITEEKRTGG
ncbi:MAG: manganese-binding transcriptional regulator MntR [Planctomycetota bacterium]